MPVSDPVEIMTTDLFLICSGCHPALNSGLKHSLCVFLIRQMALDTLRSVTVSVFLWLYLLYFGMDCNFSPPYTLPP